MTKSFRVAQREKMHLQAEYNEKTVDELKDIIKSYNYKRTPKDANKEKLIEIVIRLIKRSQNPKSTTSTRKQKQKDEEPKKRTKIRVVDIFKEKGVKNQKEFWDLTNETKNKKQKEKRKEINEKQKQKRKERKENPKPADAKRRTDYGKVRKVKTEEEELEMLRKGGNTGLEYIGQGQVRRRTRTRIWTFSTQIWEDRKKIGSLFQPISVEDKVRKTKPRQPKKRKDDDVLPFDENRQYDENGPTFLDDTGEIANENENVPPINENADAVGTQSSQTPLVDNTAKGNQSFIKAQENQDKFERGKQQILNNPNLTYSQQIEQVEALRKKYNITDPRLVNQSS